MKADAKGSELVANIGPRESWKRRALGIAALIAGAVLVFSLFVINAPRAYRLLVFFPMWIAALGFFQAKERTCVALAGRGTCNMDSGEIEIRDNDLAERLKLKARRINRQALIAAATVTLVALAFPSGH
jgi:hypothetical protein